MQQEQKPQNAQKKDREQPIVQEKPSHMNQGDETFYPNQQKKEQNPDERTGQKQDNRFRKAS